MSLETYLNAVLSWIFRRKLGRAVLESYPDHIGKVKMGKVETHGRAKARWGGAMAGPKLQGPLSKGSLNTFVNTGAKWVPYENITE